MAKAGGDSRHTVVNNWENGNCTEGSWIWHGRGLHVIYRPTWQIGNSVDPQGGPSWQIDLPPRFATPASAFWCFDAHQLYLTHSLLSPCSLSSFMNLHDMFCDICFASVFPCDRLIRTFDNLRPLCPPSLDTRTS